MSAGGARRLRYERRMDEPASAVGIEENSFSRVLQELRRHSILVTILESSDPSIVAFVNFLKSLMINGFSLEKIEEFAELFLMSQQMFARGMHSSRLVTEINSTLLFLAYNRAVRDIDAFNALAIEVTQKCAQTQTDIQQKVVQQIVESYMETNRILREIIKQHCRENRVLSKPVYAQEPAKVKSSMKSLPSSERRVMKDRWMRARISADTWQVHPAPVVQTVILEMIRSAKTAILVQARHEYVSKSILAEIENRSKQGLNVTLITDNYYPSRDGERTRLNVGKISQVPATMFIKDNYEVLFVGGIETPESCFGIKFFLKAGKST